MNLLENIFQDIYGTGYFQILLTLSLSVNTLLSIFDLQILSLMLEKPSYTLCNSSQPGNNTWITKAAYQELQRNHSYTLTEEVTTNDQCYAFNSLLSESLFECNSFRRNDESMEDTVRLEFRLFCDREFYNVLIRFIHLAASGIGYFIALSTDTIGRVKVYRIFQLVMIISNIGTVLSGNVEVLMFFVALRGFSDFEKFLAVVHLSEFTPVNKRAFYINAYWIPYTIGYIGVPGLAYFIRDWRMIKCLSFTFIPLQLLSCWLFIKSPRWLILHGRYEEAVEILSYISKMNKANLSKNYFETLKVSFNKLIDEYGGDGKNSENLIDGLKHRCILKRIVVLSLTMMAVILAYFGLLLNTDFISDNIMLRLLMHGVVELPAVIISYFMSHFIGRRISTFITFLLTIGTLFSTQFLQGFQIVKIVVSIFGKLFLACTYAICNCQIIECLPTSLRNSSMMLLMFAGVMTSAFSSFINEYLAANTVINVYAASLLGAAILNLAFIPETKDKPLPNKIIDVAKKF